MKIVGYLLYIYLRFVFLTTRWKFEGYEHVLKRAKNREAQIFAFWHGRMAMMPAMKPPYNQTHVMVSRHTDGEWISTILRSFGLGLVRGSSRRAGSKKERGGRHALIGALKVLEAGDNLAITPDGPRGPRQRVNGHVADIAAMAGAVIVPMSYSTRFGVNMGSWDKFLVPLPFGRGWYVAGEAIAVPKGASAETLAKAKKDVEDAMNHLTAKADKKAGRITPTPA